VYYSLAENKDYDGNDTTIRPVDGSAGVDFTAEVANFLESSGLNEVMYIYVYIYLYIYVFYASAYVYMYIISDYSSLSLFELNHRQTCVKYLYT
jgi:hypothetical protein